MLGIYINNKAALNFLQSYDHNDIVAITFVKQSAGYWTITPPERERMIAAVNSSNIDLFKVVCP